MTDYCLSSNCLNGNCIGCQNGKQYCNDPRCFPNCPNCPVENNKRNIWDWILVGVIIVLIILIIILFVFSFSNKKDDCVSYVPSVSFNISTKQLKPIITQNVYPAELNASLLAKTPVENSLTFIEDVPLIKTNIEKVSNYDLDMSLDVPDFPDMFKIPNIETPINSNVISQSSLTATIPNNYSIQNNIIKSNSDFPEIITLDGYNYNKLQGFS